jgi:hypothetical protein
MPRKERLIMQQYCVQITVAIPGDAPKKFTFTMEATDAADAVVRSRTSNEWFSVPGQPLHVEVRTSSIVLCEAWLADEDTHEVIVGGDASR